MKSSPGKSCSRYVDSSLLLSGKCLKIHRIFLNITTENERCCSCMCQFIITLHCSLHKANWSVWNQVGLSWQSWIHEITWSLSQESILTGFKTFYNTQWSNRSASNESYWQPLSLNILTTDWLIVHLMAARQDVSADVTAASVILSWGVLFIDGRAKDSSWGFFWWRRCFRSSLDWLKEVIKLNTAP